MLFLDRISRKSYDNACWAYISIKNVLNLLKKSMKDTEFLLSDIGSLWIPTQYGVLDLGSEGISCLIAKEDLLSHSLDLSANCECWIYEPNGSGIQILGIRSRDPFSGSTDMSAADPHYPLTETCGP